MVPRARYRVTRPSGATPTALMPAPQTTATPQPRFVPARRTAKVSLRTVTRLAQPREHGLLPTMEQCAARYAELRTSPSK